ncbi:MAG: TadE/TadG family type IV pilus assembly protein [bacterium]|nr:TadE/TadG family type IV pilus assembly protein [bacterium]
MDMIKPISDCGLWIADCGMRNAECGLWIAEWLIRNLQSAIRNLQSKRQVIGMLSIRSIQSIRNPKSEIRNEKIRNPQSAIRNPQSAIGQSLVELSIVLPIFLFMVITLFELLLLTHNYLVVAHAASEAARFGAAGGTDAQIVDLIKGYDDNLISTVLLKWKIGDGYCEIDGSGISIDPPQETRTRGTDIQVTLDYAVAVDIGNLLGADVLVLPLPASAKMPVE